MWYSAAFAGAVLGTISCAAVRSASQSSSPRPLIQSDQVTRLALTDALEYFRPPRGRLILTRPGGDLDSSAIPERSDWRFVILSPDDVQRFADDSGDLSYLEVFPVTLVADTALVDITVQSAYRRASRESPVMRGGASACTWIIVRRSEGWVTEGRRACFVLD